MTSTPSTVVFGPAEGLSRGLADRLDGVVADIGQTLPPDIANAVVVVGTDPPARPAEVATLPGDDWDRIVDGMMWRALTALQQARSAFGNHGGRIAVVVPTIGIAGAAGLVPYTTALEGIRAITKSAARQWYRDEVVVNLVAAPLRLFAAELDASSAYLTAAVVNDDSTLLHTVVESVTFLFRKDIRHLVGETIVADGGAVMLP